MSPSYRRGSRTRASGSGTSMPAFGSSVPDTNAGETRIEGEQRNQAEVGAYTSGSAGDAMFDGFFNFAATDNLGFGLGQVGEPNLNSISFNHNLDQHDFGMGCGSNPPASSDFTGAAPFPEDGFLNLNTSLECQALSNHPSNHTAESASRHLYAANTPHFESDNGRGQSEESSCVNTIQHNKGACNVAAGPITPLVVFPMRNPHTPLHTPPEELLSSFSDDSSRTEARTEPLNASLAEAREPAMLSSQNYNAPPSFQGFPVSINPSRLESIILESNSGLDASNSSRAGPSRVYQARSHNARAPYPGTTQSKKGKEKVTKAKTKAERNVWHVITAPTPEPAQSESSAVSGNSSTTADPSLASGSNSKSAGKRPAKRKEVFQHVQPSTEKSEKPEWYVSPPPWTPSPLLYQDQRRSFVMPKNHSDMGWVLARLREPGCERPTYSWAIAQIHSPHLSSYLILSGPHMTKIKTVREYDRMAYSPEKVAELKERALGKKPGAKVEKVYDVITVDPATAVRLSSTVASLAASGNEFSLLDS